MAQALLPLKDLVQAKTRLSGLLRPSERRALAQAMAEDVLAVLAVHPEIARITLVSDDPGGELLAHKYGADCWPERTLGCHGLNPLLQCASARLLSGYEEPIIVLHADLPLLAQCDISAVLSEQRALRGLVIGSDRQGSGTNLLAFDAAAVPRFCFGVDSCDAHAASAREAGIPVTVLHRPGVGADVDSPADLKWVMGRLRQNPNGNTATLLHNTALGARVTLALATMPVDPGRAQVLSHKQTVER
jgi:2-phospho-L-lactate guanylyltransferase